MDQWCHLTGQQIVTAGQFVQWFYRARSASPLHLEPDFLTELSSRIMARYESIPVVPIKVLPMPTTERPTKTRHFYRRMFDDCGRITSDFMTWASETLALWIEQEHGGSLYSEGGQPHASDPAYDVLSVCDLEGVHVLRVTQVKATQSNVQDNASVALSKFSKLESGYYNPELASRLDLMSARKNSPAGIDFADLLFAANRQYRVVLVHEEDTNGFAILTRFDKTIVGAMERRSAVLIQVHWESFWSEIGKRVYEQLS